MPEQAEWIEQRIIKTPPPPLQVDMPSFVQATEGDIADLKSAVMALTDEVQHLREDLARIVSGQSSL